MKNNWLVGFVGLVLVACFASPGRAEEAAGTVTEVGYGSFKLHDGDITRLFNLSKKSSQFEPDFWRPAVGDEIDVDFLVVPGRRSGVTLTVVKSTLRKAGPNTPADLQSPVNVEIVEVGRSGVRARIEGGHILKFTLGRGLVYMPPGWVPMPGEKAVIAFRVQPDRFGFNVDYLMETMEKIRKTPAPDPDE